MSLRSQRIQLAAQGARERREVYGAEATYEGVVYCIALSAVTKRRDVEAGGFELQPDFVGRIDVAKYPAFLPVLGKNLTVSGQNYMITAVAPSTLGGEIRIELAKS
jgi:hypothetical protein